MHWLFYPINLFNTGLGELGAEMPPQGPNVNTPRKRLPLARGTGQHRDLLLQAHAQRLGVADLIQPHCSTSMMLLETFPFIGVMICCEISIFNLTCKDFSLTLQ